MKSTSFNYSTSKTCSYNVRVELLSHGQFGVSTSVCHIQHRMLIVSSNSPIHMTKLKQYLVKAGLNTTTGSISNMAGQLEAAFFLFLGLVKTTTVSCAKYTSCPNTFPLYVMANIHHPKYSVEAIFTVVG